MKKVLGIILAGVFLVLPMHVNAQWVNGGTKVTTLDSVGIGTSYPSKNLTLSSGSNVYFRIQKPQYPDFFDLGITTHTADIRYTAGTSTNSNIRLLTNELARMYIRHDGNVGIGTTSPSSKLHVHGAIRHASSLVSQGSNYASTWMQFSEHQYGNSLILGAGGLTVLGSGESANHLKNNVGAGNETLFLSADQGLRVVTNLQNGWESRNNALEVLSNGNVGIGTTSPDEKLTVKGKIHAEEVKVDLSVPGPDYVFEQDYDLTSLKDLEAFIKANKHLPEVPSAKEMEEQGIDLGVMNMLLLKKIEELTLYAISQEKALDARHKMLEEERATNNIQQGTLNSQQQQLQSQQELMEKLLKSNQQLIKRIEQLETKGDK